MPYLFRIARESAGILIAAMLVSLFTGLMLVKYPLFPWINYNLVRDIHVFFILIVLLPAFYLHSLGGLMMIFHRKGLAKTRVQQGSIIIGWAAVFLVFGLVYSMGVPVASATGPAMNVTGPVSFKSPTMTLTQAEIAAHSSAASCWVIIGGKVYDLTTFLAIHPGGEGTIAPYCGKDGSAAFATKDKGSSHSSYADTLLSAFYLGDFGAAVTGAPSGPGAGLPVPSGSLTPATSS
ncbi:MAG TPA: cytochrome b5 domain-containing protein, partial [Methanoregula sp.]|nr:cytochrome b5 domain-containing protein [Methanoregula sp.]